METETALITGITGQDGRLLTDLLISWGYEVTLYRNTGGVSIDVANIRLDKIKEVL